MDNTEWLQNLVGDIPVQRIAKTAGVSNSTLRFQLEHNKLSSDVVIRIAVAYGQNPAIALADTGHIDRKWTTPVDRSTLVQDLTDEALALELSRRLKHAAELKATVAKAFTTPLDEL